MQPRGAQPLGAFSPFASFAYDFDLLVDVEEVAQAVATDPVLVSRGLVTAGSDHFGACFATLPANPPVALTEWHNRILDHYFLSSSAAENQAIDSGAAGPGWERTGEAFTNLSMDSLPWRAAGIPVLRPARQFPAAGACPPRTVTVLRLFNDRAAFGDSNHSYVGGSELYAQMMARGWIGEGVAMCLPQSP